jgi:hypothetical protein
MGKVLIGPIVILAPAAAQAGDSLADLSRKKEENAGNRSHQTRKRLK